MGALGIRSLMVEGGASVIRAFLTAAGSSASPVVDTVIVTVAPVLVGNEGVGYGSDLLADAVRYRCFSDQHKS